MFAGETKHAVWMGWASTPPAAQSVYNLVPYSMYVLYCSGRIVLGLSILAGVEQEQPG